MDFNDQKPIYLQIAEQIAERILDGSYKNEQRIPSVREWAAQVGVNPNTVASAYDTLATKGIIENQRGIGYFVSKDAKKIIVDAQKDKFINEELPNFVKRANLLGVDLKQLI